MRSSAVQFRGANKVAKAYLANDVAPWSIWNGPDQLIFKYEGQDIEAGVKLLREGIQMLKDGGGEAVYTIRVYENLAKGTQITNKTPYSGSFNFALYDPAEGELTPYQNRQATLRDEYEERIAGLEKKVKEQEEAVPEEPQGIAGFFNGILDMPQVQQAIAGHVVNILSKIIPMKTNNAAQVSGIPDEATNNEETLSPDQIAKVEKAIDLLALKDPKVGDHLLAVAKIAHESPAKYKAMILML